MFELKIVAESNLEAIQTLERLFKNFEFKELKVSNAYDLKKCNVYTVTVHGDIKKLDKPEKN